MKAVATSGWTMTVGGVSGYITSKSDLRTGTTTHGKQKGVHFVIRAR